MVAIIVVAGMTFGVVAAVLTHLGANRDREYQAQRDEAELALKADMIKRGMSADEIERVLKAP
jgi:hypothetical protein